MAFVVFFRSVNVGGHQVFQPSQLAGELKNFGVTSIGAAGTYIVRANISEPLLRAAIQRKLPFKPELIICPAKEVVAFLDSPAARPPPAGVQAYVSILSRAASRTPRTPLDFPATGDWQIRMVLVRKRYVLSWRRTTTQRPIYPNEVIEKHFGFNATTRNWTTIARVGRTLKDLA